MTVDRGRRRTIAGLARRAAPLLLALLVLVPAAAAGGRGGFGGGSPGSGATDGADSADAAAAELAAGRVLYLALGDSVAAGIGASRPSQGGYAALVGGRLGGLLGGQLVRLNLAVPGETTASFVAGGQLERAVFLIETAARLGTRVGPITLTLGANDLLRAEPTPEAREAALDGIAQNLGAALDRLADAAGPATGSAGPTLIVTGYYDPTGTSAEEPGSDGWWLARLDATLAKEARQAGARWVDVAALFRGRERLLTRFPFDIHPTDAGHRAIAVAVWGALVAAATADEGRPAAIDASSLLDRTLVADRASDGDG